MAGVRSAEQQPAGQPHRLVPRASLSMTEAQHSRSDGEHDRLDLAAEVVRGRCDAAQRRGVERERHPQPPARGRAARAVGGDVFDALYPDRFYNHDAEGPWGSSRWGRPITGRSSSSAAESDLLVCVNSAS